MYHYLIFNLSNGLTIYFNPLVVICVNISVVLLLERPKTFYI